MAPKQDRMPAPLLTWKPYPRVARHKAQSAVDRLDFPWTCRLSMLSPEINLREAPRSPSVREQTLIHGMNHEEERLLSFRRWPVSSAVSADRLARAGFFYVGPEDDVECFSCGGSLKSWTYGDDVMKKHRRTFPDCAFVQGQSDNVPFYKSMIESKSHMQLLESLDSGFDPSISRPTTPCSSIIHVLPTSREDSYKSSRYGLVNISSRGTPRRSSVTSTVASDVTDALTDGIDMKQEENRRRSFAKFSNAHVQPSDLAAAGFFYTGYQDRVRCVFCGGILGMWQAGDDPFSEHEKHFPWCSFGKKGYGSDYSSTQSSPTGTTPGSDVCGNFLSAPRVTPSKYPCSPYLANYQVRLATFRNWPSSRMQTPEHLAFAGFFFTGVNDNVRCFHCDGGLRCWEPADEAWLEHAKWFPQCPYLLEVKGIDYVDSVQKTATSSMEPRSLIRSNSTAGSPCASDEESVIRRVLEMGFPQPSVEQALQDRRLLNHTATFRNVEELINAVLNVENQKKRPEGTSSTRAVAGGLFAKLRSLSRDADKSASVEKLAEENRILKHQRRCKICFDKDVSVVFLPCGHLIACDNCAPLLRSCGVCRHGIRGTLKTFLS